MKILLTGSSGQLGKQIIKSAPKEINLIVTTRKELDLSNSDKCFDFVDKYKPDWVINAGAYTLVNKAEEEPETAFAINASAPYAFAKALKFYGGNLLQISTDSVFNGKFGNPLMFQNKRSPINIYGASKALGEENIEKVLGKSNMAVILRTSWLVGPEGRNFVLNILNMHKKNQNISVVADQVGCLTSTLTLAAACWKVIKKHSSINKYIPGDVPILHWCDAGVASWYDIAFAVGEISKNIGIINNPSKVFPITTEEFPSKAKRPKYSVLECTKTRNILALPVINWRSSLKKVLEIHSQN